MKRPLLIFYILVIYVLLSFLWWAYLLFDYNSSVHELRQKITKQNIQQPKTQSYELKKIKQDYQRKKWMIIGEGGVFFVLLLLGGYFIHRSFYKEARLNRQQQNFLLAVTHELKSPLSTIKLGLQTLTEQDLSPSERSSVINDASREVYRLQNMVNNILMATRFEQRKRLNSLKILDLSALVKEVIEHHQKHKDQPLQLKSEIQSNVEIEGDETSLSMLLQNLLENAVKYSPADKTVEVYLEKQDKFARLAVADEGPGIPEIEKNKIFKRFYRIGAESTRNTRGTGLGLYIVQQVVKAHKGSIDVKDRENRGTIFEVKLPLHHT